MARMMPKTAITISATRPTTRAIRSPEVFSPCIPVRERQENNQAEATQNSQKTQGPVVTFALDHIITAPYLHR